MGLPSIEISFQTRAIEAIRRSQKGVVALVVKDAKANGPHALTQSTQIPAELGTENQAYIRRAFTGYQSPPRKVLVYVLPDGAENLNAALDWLGTQQFDYLAAPPDVTETEAQAAAAWVKEQRTARHAIYKAVLPNTAADDEGVVNFTAADIAAGGKTYTAAQYCSRMAGLIAGTPMTISCTFAPLPEVTDIERLTEEEANEAVDAGELILIHDGEKVKVGSGVNSLVTTSQEKSAIWKKLKIVEAMDMIQHDIRTTAHDSWLGKYANSYDNKVLLIRGIKAYLETLEQGGILQEGYSQVEIDLEAQRTWLESTGVDTGELSEQALKEYNTGDNVFLTASISILDVIEHIKLNFHV